MDISVLQTFVEVMRQGSFVAVAKSRNIDPSSVSRAIANLEAELGIRLFQRTTRQVYPTEEGITYFNQIEPLVSELKQAMMVVKDTSGQVGGTLRITAPFSFGHRCIVPLLGKFSRLYPDLTIDLVLTDAIVDLLAERIDIAVRLATLNDSTLIAEQLMRTQYIVCASPKYLEQSGNLQQPQDIQNHNCLLFPWSGFRTRWIFRNQKSEETAVAVNGKTMISSAIALQECAIMGLGLALLPDWLVGKDLSNGVLVNAFPDYEVTATNFHTAAWLVYPSRIYIPLKVRIFIEFLKSSIAHLLS
ncbi:transcriptional regulator [Synechococcus sp. PCC 7502]|uniref:LysR family transcriptional regulator n=1 Tax=Synechococcus sp. PCC 7502 TaxID=1173263 RepID=UPI00029FA50D|nr:LysR family transcriptional regulator [Synechococcus sp. PCC 7502]AFY75186.1 transcriptional regulator [Synechococcus sp. PCC 7502]